MYLGKQGREVAEVVRDGACEAVHGQVEPLELRELGAHSNGYRSRDVVVA